MQFFFSIDNKKAIRALRGLATVAVPIALGTAILPVAPLQAADFYVSAKGDDKNAGTSAGKPLLTLQKADSLVKPGDTVYIMAGTYRNSQTDKGGGDSSLLRITTSGTPGAWITWRNYQNDKPELIAQGCWSAIDIRASYIVLDGLTLTGNNDNVRQTDAEANAEVDQVAALTATQKLDESISPSLKEGTKAVVPAPERAKPTGIQAPSPLYNGGGVAVNSRKMPAGTFQHHLSFKNLVVRKFAGGIGINGGDYYTIENCEIYDNCWYCRYGSSGISQLGGSNFDDAPGYHNIIRNNRVYNNKTLVRCTMVDRFTDGNGIILDSLDGRGYSGGVLVENNLVYDNGGGGIHVFKSHKSKVDIVNNTVWRNQQVWNLYDLGAHASSNVRFLNNVVVADKYKTVTGVTDLPGVEYDYNIYYGGLKVEKMGPHDLFVDPLFVLASTNRKVADFRLQPGSPALNSGGTLLVPATDFAGLPQGKDTPPTRGAFQQTALPLVPTTKKPAA